MHRPAQLFPILLAIIAAVMSPPSIASEIEMADRVLIKKSERKLYLFKEEEVLRTMDIALGLVPSGAKVHEGDFRTPEGEYELTKRNAASDFFLSIQISYPNHRDEYKARLVGEDPGGQIMIHGQPNEPKHSDSYYRLTDWTEGCIALSNSDMVDVWLMTSTSTPIHILP